MRRRQCARALACAPLLWACALRAEDAEQRCRAALEAQEFRAAAGRCSAAVKAAESPEERRVAHGLLGQAYLGRNKLDKALDSFAAELQLALDELGPESAETAYAHHHVAVVAQAMGQARNADVQYAKAEETMMRAVAGAESEGDRARYEASLEEIRNNYLILLQRTGQRAAEAQLRERMER